MLLLTKQPGKGAKTMRKKKIDFDELAHTMIEAQSNLIASIKDKVEEINPQCFEADELEEIGNAAKVVKKLEEAWDAISDLDYNFSAITFGVGS